MKLVIVEVLITISIIVNGRLIRRRRDTTTEFKICVPEELMIFCKEMAAQETKTTATISCISGRDRIQCIDKIKEGQADFAVVDPEDMYVAANVPNQNFTIFEEIRTLEEPEAEFRYEGVAVVRKDLKIDDVKNIKGLKSCHTGVGRNVGYKIPITKLKNMGIIGNLNVPGLSARENELKALSEFFSEACIVGDWSPDPNIKKLLKEKYSNLCQLCEDPSKCDYPDKFSGYEGALRCLAHNGGDIAWTKVIFVRKFFGLLVGKTSTRSSDENPENFAYLCPDGTKAPITGTPCRWAARPWQGYMTKAAALKSVNDLRKKLLNLYTIGTNSHATWLEKILQLSNKTTPTENKIISPGDYLDKANYTDIVERDYGPPFKTIKFCVTSGDALEKCKDLSRSAFSRDIRPRFDCVEEKNMEECLSTIRDNGADITTLDGKLVNEAVSNYNIKPILSEVHQTPEGTDEVAIIRKNSTYKLFSDLKESSLDSNKMYFENTDALKCLVERQCDVAFVQISAFRVNNANDKDEQSWASNLKSEDYELLCKSNIRAPIDEYETCNLLKIPAKKVVTSNSKSDAEVNEISNALLSISDLYGKQPELFRLFGSYNNKSDLLFKDSAIGLEIIKEDKNSIQGTNTTVKEDINICEHEEIVLKDGKKTFDWWIKPPVTPTLSIYLYNVTNANEFLNDGSKPILNELGPYVYDEKWERKDILFNNNGTVSYHMEKIYIFNEQHSTGTEDELVVVPNILMLGTSSNSKYQPRFLRLAMSSIFDILQVKAFIEVSVRELLWGYEDPLLRLADEVYTSIKEKNELYDKFGLLYNKNGTLKDRVSVFTGANDVTKYGLIDTFNGKSQQNHWLTDTCNSLLASDGSLFPPHVSKNTILSLYNKDFCRTLPLIFEKEVNREDNISAWRFTPPTDVFDSVDKNPENRCFCPDGPPCSPSGFFNVSLCTFQSNPLMLSFPHFYLADESFRNAFEGISPPDPEKHKLYLDVQPCTGSAISVTERIQINLAVTREPDIKAAKKFPDIIFPIMWYEETVNYHPEQVTNFMKLVN